MTFWTFVRFRFSHFHSFVSVQVEFSVKKGRENGRTSISDDILEKFRFTTRAAHSCEPKFALEHGQRTSSVLKRYPRDFQNNFHNSTNRSTPHHIWPVSQSTSVWRSTRRHGFNYPAQSGKIMLSFPFMNKFNLFFKKKLRVCVASDCRSVSINHRLDAHNFFGHETIKFINDSAKEMRSMRKLCQKMCTCLWFHTSR